MNIKQYWEDVLNQDANAMRTWFAPDAWINWHNTNEHFTVEEFIRVNCEYPGEWSGKVEKILCAEDQIVTATNVFSSDDHLRFHVTSFIRILDGKIVSIDEYGGNYGEAPQWRQDHYIGSRIK